MEITFTPAALAHARAHGGAVTIRSLIISSCCGPELPPEVTPGAPVDPEGFSLHQSEGVQVYYDSLLEPRERLRIDLRQYSKLVELVLVEEPKLPA